MSHDSESSYPRVITDDCSPSRGLEGSGVAQVFLRKCKKFVWSLNQGASFAKELASLQEKENNEKVRDSLEMKPISSPAHHRMPWNWWTTWVLGTTASCFWCRSRWGFHSMIDFSSLIRGVALAKFKMEMVSSVLRSIRKGDFMFLIDCKDTYF